jgi:hypothetical protein
MVMNMTSGLASVLGLGVAYAPRMKRHRAKTHKEAYFPSLRAV